MVDLTEEECTAITATLRRVALLIEEAVEGFGEAMTDIAKSQTSEIQF